MSDRILSNRGRAVQAVVGGAAAMYISFELLTESGACGWLDRLQSESIFRGYYYPWLSALPLLIPALAVSGLAGLATDWIFGQGMFAPLLVLTADARLLLAEVVADGRQQLTAVAVAGRIVWDANGKAFAEDEVSPSGQRWGAAAEDLVRYRLVAPRDAPDEHIFRLTAAGRAMAKRPGTKETQV